MIYGRRFFHFLIRLSLQSFQVQDFVNQGCGVPKPSSTGTKWLSWGLDTKNTWAALNNENLNQKPHFKKTAFWFCELSSLQLDHLPLEKRAACSFWSLGFNLKKILRCLKFNLILHFDMANRRRHTTTPTRYIIGPIHMSYEYMYRSLCIYIYNIHIIKTSIWRHVFLVFIGVCSVCTKPPIALWRNGVQALIYKAFKSYQAQPAWWCGTWHVERGSANVTHSVLWTFR